MSKYIFIIFFFTISQFTCFAQEQASERENRHRIFIEDFIQEYQSAYEKEKIEYISNFFSSDALIITETKQLSKCGEELVPHSKIKLGISGLRIVQHSLYPEIFGVSFLQMWLDEQNGNNLESQMPGYIFLMIDFKQNEFTPIIHVRTWQPEDNVTSPKDKYNLMDFRIYDFEK